MGNGESEASTYTCVHFMTHGNREAGGGSPGSSRKRLYISKPVADLVTMIPNIRKYVNIVPARTSIQAKAIKCLGL